MKPLTAPIAIALVAMLPHAGIAGPRDPGVDHRQANQHGRIHHGVESGELTRPETHRLRVEQRHIRREEARYKSDGQLAGWERRDLHRDLNRASADIYRRKHDGQNRFHAGPPAARDPWVNQRQYNQRNRIQEGIRSGELTRDEAKALGSDSRAIRRQEREYKSDGQLTRDERQDLRQDLNALSRTVYNQKHDDERR